MAIEEPSIQDRSPCERSAPLCRRPRRTGNGCERDAHRMEQRAKQLSYGENTTGYRNLLRAQELYPDLLRGCYPVKPVVTQRCSKRSWDGQIKKWRRMLHMYDFVDFEDETKARATLRASLVRKTRNSLSSDSEGRCTAPPPTDAPQAPSSAAIVPRVRYTAEDLLRCAASEHVQATIQLPESLRFLDNRVDLEDVFAPSDDDDDEWPESPRTPFTPGYSPATSPPNSNGFPLTPEAATRIFSASTADSSADAAQCRPSFRVAVGSPSSKPSSATMWGPVPTPAGSSEVLPDAWAVHAASQVAMPLFQFACGPPLYASLLEAEMGIQRLCI